MLLSGSNHQVTIKFNYTCTICMIHFEPIDIRYVFSSDFSFTSILSRFQDELDEYSTNLLPHLEKSSVSTKKQMKSSVQNSLSDDFQ